MVLKTVLISRVSLVFYASVGLPKTHILFILLIIYEDIPF